MAFVLLGVISLLLLSPSLPVDTHRCAATWRGVCVCPTQALPSPAEDFGRPLGPPFHTQTQRFRA